MEIISYVGATASSRSGFSKHRFSGRQFGAKLPKLSLPNVFSKINNKYSFIFIIGIISSAFLLSIIVSNIITYSQNYTGPVKISSLPENEIDFLNAAMSKFAMENNENLVDENGNVLSEDGTVLTASSVGLNKPISYSSYKVLSGETISTIAKKFGLTNISTLISVNGIDNVRTLRSGQKLRIPNQDGITYSVLKGDSLSSISKKHNCSIEKILDANDLSSRDLIIGQELFIPGARMDNSALKKAMGELFIYPITAKWRLTSKFGKRADPFTGVASSHTGIDMACSTGTPIKAVMSGKVVYVGWSNIFGIYAIINHGNGYQTLYGHMSKSLCSTGQVVSQGTRIGLVGSTGYSTGPHLHFTVYKNGKLVDPLSLLK